MGYECSRSRCMGMLVDGSSLWSSVLMSCCYMGGSVFGTAGGAHSEIGVSDKPYLCSTTLWQESKHCELCQTPKQNIQVYSSRCSRLVTLFLYMCCGTFMCLHILYCIDCNLVTQWYSFFRHSDFIKKKTWFQVCNKYTNTYTNPHRNFCKLQNDSRCGLSQDATRAGPELQAWNCRSGYGHGLAK